MQVTFTTRYEGSERKPVRSRNLFIAYDTNTCSMDFSILMPDGSVLWSEENIQPGYGLYDIQLNKELEKGTYEECTFTIRCYKDGVELNGCNIAFTLYVY